MPILLALSASVGLAAGERNLYLIASEPSAAFSSTFPTLLYRLDGDRLTKVRTVTTQRQDTMFVRVYHDKGYAVVASKGVKVGSFLLDVIDLESVSTQASYDIDVCECSYIHSYLLSRNDSLIYVFHGYGNSIEAYQGVDLRTGEMSRDYTDLDQANQYSGANGNGSVDMGGGVSVRGVSRNGSEAVLQERETMHRLGWDLPEELELEERKVWAMQWVNTDYMRVISTHSYIPGYDRDESKERIYVFDKAVGAWSNFMFESGRFPFRSHRRWLVSEQVFGDGPEDLEFKRLDEQRFPPFLSAGQRFRFRERMPTGQFILYNSRTQELIAHDTGEPNSEVLYVDEDDRVYYRVSDELRLAQIENGELARPRVLVKSPVLWAVHWLFLGQE